MTAVTTTNPGRSFRVGDRVRVLSVNRQTDRAEWPQIGHEATVTGRAPVTGSLVVSFVLAGVAGPLYLDPGEVELITTDSLGRTA
jgi:hypothetical protein